MKKPLIVFVSLAIALSLNSCSGLKKKSPPLLFTMKEAPVVGETFSNQKINLGGLSGLQFKEKKGGAFYFEAISDRGPNGWSKGIEKPFLIPSFSPTIYTLKADPKSMELSFVSKLELKKSDGKPLTGLPNHRREENPIDVFGVLYSVDPMGLDTESLVSDGENGFWVADEYAPSLVHFDNLGTMKRRLTPGTELPRSYAERKTNRGFEGVAKFNQKLFGFLQSPLPGEEFVRIAEVDLESMKTSAEYFYPFMKGNSKIGDAVSLSEKEILVLEQNGEVGEKSQKDIFKIILGESDQEVKKIFITSLNETPFRNQEKIEGLTVVDDDQIAFVSDNDFGISGYTDFKTGLTSSNHNPNQLIILTLPKNLKDYK